MNKIFLIIEREFLTRVKKKSFIVMTILVPLLFAGLMAVPLLISMLKDDNHKTIAVIDQSGMAQQALNNTENLSFTFFPNTSPDSLKENFENANLYAVVTIGALNDKKQLDINLYALEQTNLEVPQYIRQSMERAVEQHKLLSYPIQGLDSIITSLKTQLPIKTFLWGKDGKETESNAGIYMGISFVSGFLIYMFIMMFGSMVMRGVIEEKTNRIIEVIISSVKPFQLMMGKIIGIAAVGLLQFVIWIVLTLGLTAVIQGAALVIPNAGIENIMAPGNAMNGDVASQIGNAAAASGMLSILSGIDFMPIVVAFLLFFLLGYLLYAALFAAVGSAVENETDTQQLVLPLTIPLIIGLLIMTHTFQYPHSSLSFGASIIPFTSPMVMMARIPFGVPLWQIVLSLGLLFTTFVAFTWLAGKIYRVGILMYGKKASLREMMKWLIES